MLRALLLIFPIFLTLLPATIPVAAQETKQVRVADAPSEEDLQIQQKVRSLIKEIPEFQDVFVTVKGGVVSLKGRVLDIEQVGRAEELAAKIDGVITVNNQITVETSVEERLSPAFERFQDRIGQLLSALPIVAVGLLVLAVVCLIGFFVARMKYPWDAIAPNRFLADLFRQLVRLAFIVLGIVLALDVMGATALLGTIVGAAGILGLAIGFAVRDTVENYIASILLSFRQPFRPRDYVDIEGREGFVMALTSRATVLMTADGNHLRIPNSTVFKSIITNYSLNPDRRFDFSIGVETDDLQHAVELGLEVINDLSFVLKDPAPDGWLDEIGDSSMVLWFGAWVDQNKTSLKKARSEAIRKVKLAFEKEGIGLPEPIYRLRFDDVPPTEAASQSAPPKRKKRAVIEDKELDVSSDQTIEKKIDEQLAQRDGDDLLNADAPQEI